MHTTTPQSPSGAVIVRAHSAPRADLGDHRSGVRMSARNVGGAFVLLEMEAAPDAHVTPHLHQREDETFVILRGRFELQIGGETIEVGPDDTVFAPRNVVHAWRCISPEGGRALILVTPGANFEAFGRAMAQERVVPSAAMADLALAPAFIALCATYGIEMLPT